ncbi:hypothetical protein BCF44_106441 [Kutzneria buriramensis]|uniref:Uncharacterized protein n=1 Tax=Kutzneria buriramensis TaxID=1045776 RepID=A0A3E0HM30_9PSEU|nr:hypothetical protein BCF44_106441 [Kutzneria buriramensis]
MTAPTPGPTNVRPVPTIITSEMPIVATSPAPTLRSSSPPSRTLCSTSARMVRNMASRRTIVRVRCRRMPMIAVATDTPSNTATHPSRVPKRPERNPSSTARDSR